MSKLHENLEPQYNIKTATDFSFGITFAVVSMATASIAFLKSSSWVALPTFFTFLFSFIAFLKPSLLSPLNKIWTAFGLTISKVTQPVIMFFLFYMFLTPLSLFYRMFAKKDLQTTPDSKTRTYWINKEVYDLLDNSMRNQF